MPRSVILSIVLLLSLALPALAPTRAAEVPAPASPLPSLAGTPFAGYELVEASYLLRAPDGTLLRVSRPGPGAMGPNATASDRARPEAWPGAPGVKRADWLQGLLGGWLYRTPEAVERIADVVREMWGLLVRMLDYLGVVVLLTGSWGVWFLARPMLPGVPDRTAFLFIFALAAGLWAYVTALYLSIAYAVGLLLLPALVAALLGYLGRQVLRLFRRPAAPGP